MMWKIQQAMQDDAIRAARIHSAIHPGNWDEVFIWQNFQPAYRDPGWKNRDLGNRAKRLDRERKPRWKSLLPRVDIPSMDILFSIFFPPLLKLR